MSDISHRKPPSAIAEFWHYFSENRGAVIGLWVFLALIVVAIFAPVIAPHDPTAQARDALLVPPVWADGGTSTYLLGTDAIGRDILSGGQSHQAMASSWSITASLKRRLAILAGLPTATQ